MTRQAPAPAQGPPVPAGGSVPRTTFRPELHGVRGLAIALVVLFHVFGRGRVSGGIDAFLAISGFLMTLSVARRAEDRTLRLSSYLARLLRRLLPPVLLVLAAVAAAGYLLGPSGQHAQLVRELRATLLYAENWELIASQLDYAAAGPGTSPLQHFWSLSVQGQFYLLWFFLVAGAAWLGRRLGRSVWASTLVAVGAVTVVSFLWQVLVLSHDQQVAYLHTGGRLWELGLGGLVGLLLPSLSLRHRARVVLGWVGVALLVSCGFVLDGRALFPGPWALWPVVGVLLVLVAGTTHARGSADRLLGLAPVRFLGDISYAWYLWHWPLLIYLLHVTGRESADVPLATLVLVVSVLLAWLTTRFVEAPAHHALGGRERLTLVATACVLALSAVTAGAALSHLETRERAHLAAAARPSADHPGAAVLGPDWEGGLPEAAPVPDLSVVPQDLPEVYDLEGCVQTHRDTPESVRPGLCDLGPEGADRTVLVTGGSHVAQWMPALRLVAEQEGWRLVFTEKGGCQFLPRPEPGSQDPPQTDSCYGYTENLWPMIEELDPDYLFTIGTTSRPVTGEATPEGFLTQWRRLDELGVTVLAVRDTTRLQENAAECLERTGLDAVACGQPRTERLRATSPLDAVEDLPGNVRPVDLTDRICRPDWCRAVEGNVVVYRDTSHVTATYMRTLAPFLRDALKEVAPELF